MNFFIGYIFLTVISGFIGFFISSFALIIAFLPNKLYLSFPEGLPRKVAGYTLSAISVLIQLAWWAEWSAFCSAIARAYGNNSSVPWIYFIISFFEANWILALFAVGELEDLKRDDNRLFGVVAYQMFISIIYVIFFSYPSFSIGLLPSQIQHVLGL